MNFGRFMVKQKVIVQGYGQSLATGVPDHVNTLPAVDSWKGLWNVEIMLQFHLRLQPHDAEIEHGSRRRKEDITQFINFVRMLRGLEADPGFIR